MNALNRIDKHLNTADSIVELTGRRTDLASQVNRARTELQNAKHALDSAQQKRKRYQSSASATYTSFDNDGAQRKKAKVWDEENIAELDVAIVEAHATVTDLEKTLAGLEKELAAASAETQAAKEVASSVVKVTLNDLKKHHNEIVSTEQNITKIAALIAENEAALQVDDNALKEAEQQRQTALADVALGTQPKSTLAKINEAYQALKATFESERVTAANARDIIKGLQAKLAEAESRLTNLRVKQQHMVAHYLKSQMATVEDRYAEKAKELMAVHEEYASLYFVLAGVPGYVQQNRHCYRPDIEWHQAEGEVVLGSDIQADVDKIIDELQQVGFDANQPVNTVLAAVA